MSEDLGGRIAIVTGASGGIGSAICRALAARGVRVAGFSRTTASAATHWFKCDVADETAVRSAVELVERQLGSPTLLVCSSGVVSEHAVDELTLDEWRRVVDASLTATFLVCRAVVPLMRAARDGRIVALSSGYATKGYARGGHYAAAKAGVEALVKSLALETARDGIVVNAVAPGPIETPMIGHFSAEPGRRERTAASIPQGRIGSADDVVGAVLFFLSDASRYVTGQVLQVNGGMLMP